MVISFQTISDMEVKTHKTQQKNLREVFSYVPYGQIINCSFMSQIQKYLYYVLYCVKINIM